MNTTVKQDELIERTLRLETGALDNIVDKYASRLYGFMYRMTGGVEDAEDLVQEVFLRLVRGLGDYEHDGRFEAWLFRIAGNVARDRARRRRTQGQSAEPLPTDLELVSANPDKSNESAGPFRTFDNREHERLQAAIDQLPEAERQVVLLRHYAELSFQEIADMMETPLGTALARAHRGLARLRGLMEADA